MAKIIDPDDLTFEVVASTSTGTADISYITDTSRIEIQDSGGLLNDDGVSLQAIYSKTKEVWKADVEAIKFNFPFDSITPEQFELIQDWQFLDASSINFIRDSGFLYRDSGGIATAEFIGFDSVFPLNNNAQAGGDQVYVELDQPNGTVQNMFITGQANQPIQTFGDASNGNIDFRANDLRFFVREQGKLFGQASVSGLNVPLPLTYKKYSFPISNDSDTKINASDATIGSTAPYTGMDIISYDGVGFTAAAAQAYAVDDVIQDGAGRWAVNTSAGTLDAAGVLDYTNNGGTGTFVAYQGERLIGSTYSPFSLAIDGNLGTAEEIYEFIQFQLRQAGDIDSDVTNVLNGLTSDSLLQFIGDTLRTLRDRNNRGVYIDNFQANDTNRIEFTDNEGNLRTFPFVAAGSLEFNANLVNDGSAEYWLFFTNTNGNQYGTTSAIIMQDNSTANIEGIVSGASIPFDFDYDGNVQGGRTAGTDAPYTGVAIGLDTGQYVVTTGSITRNVGQTVNFVAGLERNYSNPI